ncbi:MAG: hypothetical protein WBP91_13845 [Terriglobales bacterium]
MKRHLTGLDNCLFRRFLVTSDQESKPTQNISLILEAGYDFGWRRITAGIDCLCDRMKPGHDFPLSMPLSNGLNWMGMPD